MFINYLRDCTSFHWLGCTCNLFVNVSICMCTYVRVYMLSMYVHVCVFMVHVLDDMKMKSTLSDTVTL